jgi:hypothetical protein
MQGRVKKSEGIRPKLTYIETGANGSRTILNLLVVHWGKGAGRAEAKGGRQAKATGWKGRSKRWQASKGNRLEGQRQLVAGNQRR